MLMHTGQTASSTSARRPSNITLCPTSNGWRMGSVVLTSGKREMTMTFLISDRLRKTGIQKRKVRPKYWASWHEDPKLSGIVASFETALGSRLSVHSISNTGVPLLYITSARRSLRYRAKKIGLVWGKWPKENGTMITAWLPSRPLNPLPSNPYLEVQTD